MTGPRSALALLCALVVAGCGSIDDFPLPDDGRVCYLDSDCVPNACCGEGNAAVHLLDAPDCSAVKCSGSCSPKQVNCGCGLPVCRSSRCTVAVSTDPRCG